MGVQAMKHAALLREWTARFAECRSSGMTVKAWCEAQGLSIKTYYYWEKRVIAQANQEASVSAQTKAGALMRVNPDILLSGGFEPIDTAVTIRHGESVISLPPRSSAEALADLVKALNRHV